MAEIKSTLDLIMEKTKGLTLSPKEREEIRREEWLKKARGWIQKFLDGWVDMAKVKDELFSQEAPAGWKKILQPEIVGALEPAGDNEKRFELVTGLLELPREPFLKILKVCNQTVEGEKLRLMEQLNKSIVGPRYFRLGGCTQSGSRFFLDTIRDPGKDGLQRKNA